MIAEAIIFATLHGENGVALKGHTAKINESLAFLASTWNGLSHGAGTWSAAKANFVEVFTNLVNKSATQVAHSSKSYAEIHEFLSLFDNQALLSEERPIHVVEEVVAHHHSDAAHEEVKGTVEGEIKVGEHGNEFRGNNRRGGRGGNFRGNNFRKHNTDDEGFIVVKEEEGEHYPSRRQRGGRGGEFRGNRGTYRGGEHRGEHRGEYRGGRGGDFNRGGEIGERGRGGRPWVQREHRGRGDVRRSENPGEDHPEVVAAKTEAPVIATPEAAAL